MSMTELRPYQQEAVRKIISQLKPGARIMYQLPTGGGKTRIAIEVITEFLAGVPILRNYTWLTHRDILQSQSSDRLHEAGLNFGTVSTPQKIWNAIQRGDLKPTPETLLVVDESHHSSAKTWTRVIKGWPGPGFGLDRYPLAAQENRRF